MCEDMNLDWQTIIYLVDICEVSALNHLWLISPDFGWDQDLILRWRKQICICLVTVAPCVWSSQWNCLWGSIEL